MMCTAIPLALALCCAVAIAGCNLIELQRDGLESTLHDAGLTAWQIKAGADDVRVWTGGAAEGPVVVLLHGFGPGAIWQWSPQAEALAAEYRVVVPDLLWFGDSRSSNPDYTLDHQARAVLAVLDALGHDATTPVHLVGVSYGGFVGWTLAHTAPTRIASLTLIDSPGHLYTDADRVAMLERFGVASLDELFVPDDERDIERLLEIAYDDPPWTPGWARDQILDGLYATHPDEKTALLDQAFDEIVEDDSDDALAPIPTQLIWGRDDRVFPVELAGRVRDTLGPTTALHVIDEARHAPQLEQPEAVNALLLEFVEANAAQ